MTPVSAAERIASLDTSLLLESSQTGPGDRRSFLLLQNVVRLHRRPYVYLEIGSHLGGSLAPHLSDPECRCAVSVDPRPLSQPDERARDFDYPENSTAAMVAALSGSLPATALLKLMTFDLDAKDVRMEMMPAPADLVLIDAEHTNTAVFRDFLSARRLVGPSCVMAFHDANLIFDGLLSIKALLRDEGRPFAGFFLPDNVYALLLGDFVGLSAQGLSRAAFDREVYIPSVRRALRDLAVENIVRQRGEEARA